MRPTPSFDFESASKKSISIAQVTDEMFIYYVFVELGQNLLLTGLIGESNTNATQLMSNYVDLQPEDSGG